MDSKTTMHETDRMSFLSTTTDDLPPPYEDLSRPASSILTDVSSATLTGPTASIPSRPFPTAFNLYYPWHGKPLSRSTKFFIGEHLEQPCNAVVLGKGFTGIQLTIHEGIQVDSPVMATTFVKKAWSNTSAVTLPGVVGADGQPIEHEVEMHAGFKHVSWTFSVEVSNADSKPHTEKFEWRLSHGKEVKDLDKWSWGWKLVRLDGPVLSQPSGSSSKREDRDHGLTSDGKEVVAVWATNSHWSKMGQEENWGGLGR
ncbi:hypothetical protein PRZ48_007837 [Zasmidium cellare]|uniref:Uncharacterized protein n=1 Tax=Zasmidium cellare TaxID=395010 RepID=A0ABR0ELJ0_ZASCE|nr:hypothetical protein PRZ48_007837 [Zasmidium cellare]